MKKATWADIDDEEREKEDKYIPPHKKYSPPLVETVNKKVKLPHSPNPKKP